MIQPSEFLEKNKFKHINLHFRSSPTDFHSVKLSDVKDIDEHKSQYAHIIQVNYQNGSIFRFDVESIIAVYLISIGDTEIIRLKKDDED